MDREAWHTTVYGIIKLDMTERLNCTDIYFKNIQMLHLSPQCVSKNSKILIIQFFNFYVFKCN